jgi:UDP-N-acetylglucosamine 2-epimerase (non-hydrolysing)
MNAPSTIDPRPVASGPLVDLIAGARPNFMKIAPIVRALHSGADGRPLLRYRLVHTGQHYDARMSADFFDQLGIPTPEVNLQAGSGSQAEQTATIMIAYERVLLERPSDLCLVVGDVTSTMACAIAAKKLCIAVAHVEAGIRSGDWTMPEEINRVVTDSICDYYFTTSRVANEHLRRAGVANERIFFVGNTMIDSLLANRDRLRRPPFWETLGLRPGEYFIATLHRPANVDDPANLGRLLDAVAAACRGFPVIFPLHPRTERSLRRLTTCPTTIKVVDPQPYLEFIYLMRHAKGVITDSGGVTEETTVMGVPCITMRDSTERPETITDGTNVLIGSKPDRLRETLDVLFDGRWKHGTMPELWDGRAAERIVAVLERELAGRAARGRDPARSV